MQKVMTYDKVGMAAGMAMSEFRHMTTSFFN